EFGASGMVAWVLNASENARPPCLIGHRLERLSLSRQKIGEHSGCGLSGSGVFRGIRGAVRHLNRSRNSMVQFTGALAFVMVFGFPGGDRGIVHGEPDVIVYAVNVGARWSSSEDSRVYKIDPSICRSSRIPESDLFFDLGIVFPDEF